MVKIIKITNSDIIKKWQELVDKQQQFKNKIQNK